MPKIYKSKIGAGLVIPLTVVIGTVLFIMTYHEPHWLGTVIVFPIIAFIVHMFRTTYYLLISNKLKIKCGLFYEIEIDISTIKKISPTKSPLSSPALSFDRLNISYGKFDEILISPKDKKDFIEALMVINPGIELTPILERLLEGKD